MIKIPCYLITADHQPLNEHIVNRIISIEVKDKRANEADELTLVLDDSDAVLELPKRGVKLNCLLGFLGDDLFDKGDFIVDETEWSGPPDIITVKASSANFKGKLKVAKSKSFHRKKFGEIANEIAANHELSLVMTEELQQIDLQHIDQTNESDLNLLARLAKQNGAEMAVKKDRLLIFNAGSAKTASGQDLDTIFLTRHDGNDFKYSEQDRESDYTGVTAGYQNTGKAKREIAHAGEQGKVRRLKGTYADQAAAQRAANAKMSEIKRQKSKFSMRLAIGMPEISTESPVVLRGFKKEIDGMSWIVSEATHTFDKNSGLVSVVELESGG